MEKFLNVKNEYYVGNVIEEADDDCDGGLNLKEFTNNLIKLLKPNNSNNNDWY